MEQEYVGIVEIEENVYTVVRQGDYIIMGGVCNVGLMPEFMYKMDDFFSFDENLQECIFDLEAALTDGVQYTTENFQEYDANLLTA